MQRVLRLMVVLMAAALVLGACGDSDDDTDAAPTTEATDGADGATDGATDDTTGDTGADDATPAGTATVAVAENDEFGSIVVDSEGMSLYVFTQDSENESNCTDGCLDVWPPLTVDGEVTGGDGIDASLLGTITREDDGSTQVTLDGQPLYYYAPDTQPGDTMGQGVGGNWFLVGPDGSLIEG